MAEFKLPDLRWLRKAMRLTGERGMCIHRSSAFVFDVPASTLMFGTFRPPADHSLLGPDDSRVPFIHCWAEYKGLVFAPTTIEREGRLVAVSREVYYRVNDACDFYSLSRAQLLRLDRQHGLKFVLRHGGLTPDGLSYGGTLLDAAGVAWKVGKDGGTLPPYVDED